MSPVTAMCIRSLIVGAVVGLMMIAGSGCSSDSSSSGTGSSMQAIVGTSNWSAQSVQASNANGVIVIGGTDATGSIQIQLRTVGVTAPGTVTIGAGAPHSATLSEYGTLYTANSLGGSGTITFSALTAQHAEGTFTFTGISSDAKLSRAVTAGKFSVRFP